MAKLIGTIPDDLYDRVRAQAELEERSLIAIVRRALRTYLEDDEADEAEAEATA